MLPNVGRLCRSGIDRIRIEGKYMNAKDVGYITQNYRELLDGKLSAEVFEGEDITRGHYFRGVL